MRSRNLFLLVYFVWSCFGASNATRNATCGPRCGQVPDPTSHFLQCVGLPSTDTGKDHMRRLKEMLEATMDVYTFMRSSMTGVPLLSLQGALHFDPDADPLQNEVLVKMWIEVKLKPLLKSFTKHFLSCLSTKNFSCSTYQTVVSELSHHYSEMNPARQKWIYTFFMYPFLSGDTVAGCVDKEESSEEWLMKNFGAFRAMARMKDFSTLNMVFSGLEVLHLLSPVQKAELLLRPEVASLDNGTLALVFHNFLTGGPPPTAIPGGVQNCTTPGYPQTYHTQPTHDPYLPASPHNPPREVVNGFAAAFRSIGSFVHEFVSFTRERDVSQIRSAALTQFLLNWTLAELADMYRPGNTTVPPEFDVTNVEDWYEQVVVPLLRRFLPSGALIHQNITMAFHQVFYLDHGMGQGTDNETSEILDVCSITLDKASCGLTDAVVNVAKFMHCAARTNLTMSEETVMRLIVELTERLNSLVKYLYMANFSEVASDFKQIFGVDNSPSLSQEHLNDPDFIKLWFQIKLMPLLPDIPVNLLSCLSTKNFTCPVYQTIVAALGQHMSLMDAPPEYSRNIYKHFIYPFLLHHNTSDPQCLSSANHSAEWLDKNFGVFSRFASITDFYKLNQNFSGLEVLPLLSPNQTAELLLLPLPTPPEKDVVINRVFDFLLESPEDRKLKNVLHSLVQLTKEVNPPCSVYRHIFDRLYKAVPSLPPDLEFATWASIDDLINITPEECLPENIMCQVTQYNATKICSGIDSSGLQSHLHTSMEVPCNFSLETYACAQLENFTAYQLASLLKCNLPGNSSHSIVLWKMLLTKLSFVLDPALDILANMSSTTVVPSAMEVLDVIGELRVSLLTDEQLMNNSIIMQWFSSRLRRFLPSASGRFLTCLSRRNLSCHSYQQILQVFIHHFDNMTLKQQNVVLKDFILRFLSHSGPSCVSISNSSADWLMKNLGPFSGLLSVEELFELNPRFKPLEVLQLLTPKQSAELLVLTHPNLPDKDAIINMIFDYLTESPDKTNFTEFLSNLVMFLEKGNLSCSSYKTLFNRLDLALATVSTDVASSIVYSKAALSSQIPPGCIIYSGQCNVTPTNVTDICAGVNSSMLQLHLASEQMNGSLCDFAVEEIACASLSALKAEDLAAILACNRSISSSSSKPVWKLLLSKAPHVLDEALDLLTNKSLDLSNPAVAMILDAIREIRLDVFNMDSLNNPAIIQLWFNNRLRPFLPAVSPDFLSCLTTQGLNCSTFQHIVRILSQLQPHVTPHRQMSVYTHFIKPFLTRNNTRDPQCLSSANQSAEWLKNNFGVFSRFASITDFYKLNQNFSGLEVLPLLSPNQTAELLLLPLPTPPEKDVVINRVFDFLLESPENGKLINVLYYLVQLAKEVNPPCSVYRHIFDRLYKAVPSLPPDLESAIWASIDDLINITPEECLPQNITCQVTQYNATKICSGIDSSGLQSHLHTSMEVPCNFSLETYACAQLENFTAYQLASLLKCNLPGNSSHSIVLWKMLLTKLSFVLDPALDILANMSSTTVVPSAMEVLDVIGELRVSLLTDEQLMNNSIIMQWFSSRLRRFLPSASGRFLTCLSRRNLSCHSYQQILQVFIHHFDNMTLKQQNVVLKDFILRFLSHSGPSCVSISNSSADWLMKNLGPFSGLLSVEELFELNPRFKPLEVLQLLTPKQSAELLVLTHPNLPDKDAIINMIFDYLTESPDKTNFTEFLSNLVMFLEKGNLSCSSYKTLFNRLDLALATVSTDVASSIVYSKAALSSQIPPDCIIYSGQCNVTPTNVTDICAGVNSSMLQLHLASGQMNGSLCDFAVEEIACASLSALKAEDLAAILACNRSISSSSSKPVWKLLLSKAPHVLDEALDLLTNKSLDLSNPAVAMILDAIREIRLDVFNMDSLNNPAIIQLWFNNRLRPFLPAVSPDFLSCLTTQGLNCSTFQHIVRLLSQLQPHMTPHRQMSLYTHFIKPFLTRNNTRDPQCLSSANQSAEWLKNNFGVFSRFASITDFYKLNQNFSGLEVLPLLSPNQTAELLLLPLPTPPEKDVVINRVFDFLLESPENGKLINVLYYLVQLAKEVNPPCSVYRHIFDRLYKAVPSLPPDLESAIWASIDDLINITPEECLPQNITCQVTQYNATKICSGIDSSGLQSHLHTSMEVPCNFSLETYACAQLENFTAYQLASLLKCNLPGNSSHSIVLWKMLLTKLSFVLDPALDILANMSSTTVVPSAMEVLDVIGELRVSLLTDEQLMNNSIIMQWFSSRLRRFLPSASGRFLTCLSRRNLSCHSYQQILQVFIHHFDNMTLKQQNVVLKDFILRFLSHSGPSCVSISNSSADWLMKNLGPFSGLLSVEELFELNPRFKPLEVLQLLTPKQSAELLVLTHLNLPDKDAIINMIFDYLTESPDKTNFTEFLSNLVMFLEKGNLSCSSYKTLFNRLDLALATVSTDVASSIVYSKAALSSQIPPGCIIYSGQCNVTPTNVTDICAGVNSSMLQLHLASEQMNGSLCDFAVEEIACASLSALKAEDLAAILACNRSISSSSSKPVWKLLLSKAPHMLDEALDLLTNKSLDLSNPAVAMILDAIREIRLDVFNMDSLNNPAIIQLWFNNRLRPFLPAVSPDFLSCLTTQGLNCSTFQHIVRLLSQLQPHMTPHRQMSVYTHFIKPFLTRNNTRDPQCLSSANQSAEWLKNNFGVFSRFASITDFYKLNQNFSGLEVLPLLSPNQTAELLLLPLPTPPEKDVVINRVFDFLLESPENGKLINVLYYLVQLAKEVNPPCSVYRHIFDRLYKAVPSLPPDLESAIWASIDDLINITPEECLPQNITCQVTQYNATKICSGIDSSGLQSHLHTSMEVPCNFSLETYACAQLENFTAYQLASLLKCNLPGNSSHSIVLWKMLLTKLSFVLDPALDILANMSSTTVVPSAMEVLDVIGELRVSLLTDEQLMNNSIIMQWFSSRLRRFLPSASGRFLTCLSRRNLSCHSYQQILQVFIHHFDNMTLKRQNVVLKDFILRFLSHSGPSCVSISNSSADWLMKNLGPFSGLLSVKELFQLNPHFKPLEVLQHLTPKQSAELLVLTHPNLPDKDAIINMIFDYLTESPDKTKFTEFLSNLVMFLEKGNLSCSSYKTLFNRLDLALTTVSSDVASSIVYSKAALSSQIPPGCIIHSGQCNVTMTNETNICAGVNSSMLQLHLASGQMNGSLCDFPVEKIACASLSALKAEDLAAILACNRSISSSSSKPVWKLLLSKAPHVLDEALDLLTNKSLDLSNPAVAMILDAIREIRLDVFNMDILNNPAIIQLWFNNRLRPFLPAVSPDFLSCLTTQGLNCSTFQHIVQILSRLQPSMTLPRQMSVYTRFIKVFLSRTNTTDPSCSSHINNSGEWLRKNLGAFSHLVSFHDIRMLYPNFSAMEALPDLTVRQLAEVSATPGQLTSAVQVNRVMEHVPNQQLAAFFDDFSPAIMGHQDMLHPQLESAMLQVVFDRANLSDHSVSDSVVQLWLHNRLGPLLFNLSQAHVAPFFSIVAGRNCSIQQLGVQDLNSTISSLSEDTQKEIHDHIIQMLKGPVPLQCYGDNFNHSFYTFLENTFMGFQFPNLTAFLSLMPPNRKHQLLNSMPPSDLGAFLRRSNVVDNDAQLCVIYSNYVQTPQFLETESLPPVVQRPTLPCVWPVALSSTKRSEVDAWFDRRLRNYLGFLTKSLISPSSTYNASCLAFQKLVSVLGKYDYTAADFKRQDIFNTIRTYLTSATVPRCYNSNDPDLNSTAWFAEYIGSFMPFLTLQDLQMFGSSQVIQKFTVNPLNIALLNHSILPLNLTNYYTELIYQYDSNFNPLLLPLLCRCVAPGPAFVQLNAAESIVVLNNLTTLCPDLDPQISAALAGNFGDNIDSTAISALGSEITGLSMGQIMMIKPQDFIATLSTLSSVSGWNEGQAKAIIQMLLSSGMMQINSASSLFMLGSLVVGVPATTFSQINGSQLLNASKSPVFLGNLLLAPQIVQQTFVTQIISVDSNSDKIIDNIPNELATEIPRALLLGFSNSSVVYVKLNKKKWKRQQVELFFNAIAAETTTTALGSPNNLSSSVLQGFTCLGVRTIKKVQIKKLIKACRREGKNKVKLVETQLTCMYNHIKGDSDVTSFDLYPPDVLLYYDYSLVPQASCRAYFVQLANADFTVFSSALSYKRTALFANAKSCLGITNTSLTADNILVLGNMCCTLDGSYIENSDPSILEKLKNCVDLTSAQAAAAEALLLGGKTQYGAPSTWNEQTLKDLGMLPLYFSSTFYENFDKATKKRFLKYFLKNNKVARSKKGKLKREIRKSNKNKSKRSTINECTVGNITQVTISAETFPIDYDVNQFNCCLSASTVKNNLASITGKVDEENYLSVVLSKLREAYAAQSTIPEIQVQILGPASRVASVTDINMWNITQIDTLAALMASSNGPWDPTLAKVIISKYLRNQGNKLGSAELSAIGGANLCSLDKDVLKNISQQSLKDADALDVSNCTTEKKKELFTIARAAFSTTTRAGTVSASSYQLTKSYLAGADLAYVRSLSASDVNMDMATFTSLDQSVVLNLSVSEVQGLLGTNVAELKSYENQTLVRAWISMQPQSSLNTLGLGLTGGKADSTTTSTSPVTNTPTTSSSTLTPTPASGTTTGNNGSRVRADAGFFFLVLLALFITSQHTFI